MRLLLDSHALLWWLEAPEQLSERAHAVIEAGQDVIVSAATVWEIEIRRVLGKLARAVVDGLVVVTRDARFSDYDVALLRA